MTGLSDKITSDQRSECKNAGIWGKVVQGETPSSKALRQEWIWCAQRLPRRMRLRKAETKGGKIESKDRKGWWMKADCV